MPAQFIALSDSAFDLPDPEAPDNEGTRGFEFDLLGLDKQQPVVIMFKVAAYRDMSMQMVVNNNLEPLIKIRLIESLLIPQPTSWHKIVIGSNFKATKNSLEVMAIRQAPGPLDPVGYMQVSDIVIMYNSVPTMPSREIELVSEYAQFIVLPGSDSAFDVYNGSSRSFGFDLPGLDKKRSVVIMFKVAAQGHARLQMILNDAAEPIINFPFYDLAEPLQPRSWHEVTGANVYKDTGNSLVVTGDSEEENSYVQVSDITFLYHVNTEPVGVIGD
jgi:hypothetical protein